jgi:hypothetical protein
MNLDEAVNHVYATGNSRHLHFTGAPSTDIHIDQAVHIGERHNHTYVTSNEQSLHRVHATITYDDTRNAPMIQPRDSWVNLRYHGLDDQKRAKSTDHAIPLIHKDQFHEPLSRAALNYGVTDLTLIDHDQDTYSSFGVTNASIKRINDLYLDTPYNKPNHSPDPYNDAHRTGLNITL